MEPPRWRVVSPCDTSGNARLWIAKPAHSLFQESHPDPQRRAPQIRAAQHRPSRSSSSPNPPKSKDIRQAKKNARSKGGGSITVYHAAPPVGSGCSTRAATLSKYLRTTSSASNQPPVVYLCRGNPCRARGDELRSHRGPFKGRGELGLEGYPQPGYFQELGFFSS